MVGIEVNDDMTSTDTIFSPCDSRSQDDATGASNPF